MIKYNPKLSEERPWVYQKMDKTINCYNRYDGSDYEPKIGYSRRFLKEENENVQSLNDII